ncbi:DUF805 domain-containing protein [Litorimonas sp. RW-G-Af-16]|uniref:DUF805 domain-containing protein n=1 Tax=Litorimonas sp. RW-G-Af-16 TaxID=3241168 RepID=UPI00390C9D2F
MGFVEAVKSGFARYVDFSGRSSRSEYWYWTLFTFVVSLALSFLTGMVEIFGIVSMIFSLGTLIPSIAVGVRKLHDIDKSGWWLLIAFIPLLGALYLIYLFVQRGTVGPNRFGPDPLNDQGDVFS